MILYINFQQFHYLCIKKTNLVILRIWPEILLKRPLLECNSVILRGNTSYSSIISVEIKPYFVVLRIWPEILLKRPLFECSSVILQVIHPFYSSIISVEIKPYIVILRICPEILLKVHYSSIVVKYYGNISFLQFHYLCRNKILPCNTKNMTRNSA